MASYPLQPRTNAALFAACRSEHEKHVVRTVLRRIRGVHNAPPILGKEDEGKEDEK